jgi:hypothetical protein
MGQMEMKYIFNIGKYFHSSQGYSGGRCGPWVSFEDYELQIMAFNAGQPGVNNFLVLI